MKSLIRLDYWNSCTLKPIQYIILMSSKLLTIFKQHLKFYFYRFFRLSCFVFFSLHSLLFKVDKLFSPLNYSYHIKLFTIQFFLVLFFISPNQSAFLYKITINILFSDFDVFDLNSYSSIYFKGEVKSNK